MRPQSRRKRPRARVSSGLFVPHIYERESMRMGATPCSRTHRDVADAIASRNPTAAHDAMYLHLVYNRNMIAEGTQEQSE